MDYVNNFLEVIRVVISDIPFAGAHLSVDGFNRIVLIFLVESVFYVRVDFLLIFKIKLPKSRTLLKNI